VYLTDLTRKHWHQRLLISGAVTIPCFWHRHLEAGDVPSHLYNAWLGDLVAKGKAPGLQLASQSNNVLFDIALSAMGRLFGWLAAEKVVVATAVLVFFWGVYRFVSVFSREANSDVMPWFAMPCIAVFAYGWTFEMGFMNYYISLGLAFFALSLIAGGDSRFYWSLVIAPLVWLAHPLGMVVLVATTAYLWLDERLGIRRNLLFVTASAALVAAAFLIRWRHWDRAWNDQETSKYGFVRFISGADQLLLYARHDLMPAWILVLVLAGCVGLDFLRKRRSGDSAASYRKPLQLYCLSVLAVTLLPSLIVVPHLLGRMWSLGFVPERLTLVSGVFMCCLLVKVRPGILVFAATGLLAAVFFAFLYQDTATVSALEDQADRCTQSIPPGSRVVIADTGTNLKDWLLPLGANRVTITHIIDRACIGRCFSYANYEPVSDEFRVRVRSDNPIVLRNQLDHQAMRKGTFIVGRSDLPFEEIYRCGDGPVLCMRQLKVGDRAGTGPEPGRTSELLCIVARP
jgi:hypothetical protein